MDIQLPQILFQIINFGVVTGALSVLLYKPIKKMLDERSSRIEEGQKAAEEAIAEKRDIDELRKKVRREAEREAAKIMDTANQDMAARRKEALTQAKQDADAEYERKMKGFDQEKATIMDSMKTAFAEAVIAAVKKVGLTVSKKEQDEIIETQLEQLLKQI